jgi:hypothetical protein
MTTQELSELAGQGLAEAAESPARVSCSDRQSVANSCPTVIKEIANKC